MKTEAEIQKKLDELWISFERCDLLIYGRKKMLKNMIGILQWVLED
jgi:hypothetical protein